MPVLGIFLYQKLLGNAPKGYDLFCNALSISDFICCLFNGFFQVTL